MARKDKAAVPEAEAPPPDAEAAPQAQVAQPRRLPEVPPGTRLIGGVAPKLTSVEALRRVDPATKEPEPVVKIFFPRAIRFNDRNVIYDIPAGEQMIPERLADNWWFKANGAERR